MTRPSTNLFASATLVAMLLTGGCGQSSSTASSEPSFSGTYAEEYRQEYEQAKNNGNTFAMDALRDGTLTEQEVTEASDRYTQCMADRGYIVAKHPGGGSDINVREDRTPEQQSKDDDWCGKDSGTYYLDGLWTRQHNDPDKRNSPEMIVDCLRRHQVIDDDVNDEQALAKVRNWDFPEVPFDASDPEYSAERSNWLLGCMNNPREF